MKARYREFEGDNWTAEFAIESSECIVALEGATPEELLDDAEIKLLDTCNNSEIAFGGYLIRSGNKGFQYLADDGTDFSPCPRTEVLGSVAVSIQSEGS